MLRVENFVLSINRKTLIQTEHLEVKSGEKALIIGNNCSGKTYIARTLHGLNTKYSGNIMIKGKKIVLYKRKKKTLLVQNFPTYLPNETLWKNLTLPIPVLTTRQRQRLYDFCEVFNMKSIMKQPASILSHSQVKALELMRAVIQLPYLVILDDYDSYFDDVNRAKATKVLDFALSNGSAVLATSNNRLDGFDTIYRIKDNNLVKM